MKKVILWSTVIALTAVVLHLLSAQESTVPQAPATVKIGVANIEKIYNSLDRKTDYERILRKEVEQAELDSTMMEKERNEI